MEVIKTYLQSSGPDVGSEDTSPINSFYKDKVVFITGATGFMGKVLVEKLLRSTSVSKIYLLIRPKKGVATQQRLKVLLDSPCFNRVRKEREEALKKVEAVSGDITEKRLGLSEEEERMLADSVNIVFHSAATVRFDEDMSKSLEMNVSGVMAIIALAKKMTQLKALVDVSTAYCNCDLDHIEERIYPAPGDPARMVDLGQWMDPAILDSPEVTKKLIGNRPNTYTFTKALAEGVLGQEAGDLPVAVMRPSIVAASWREPFPGWVDNLNGPSGVIAGIGKGVLRTFYCKGEGIADWFPVDLCINLLLCIAWKTSKKQPGDEIKVYNCTSGGDNPITWTNIGELCKASARKAAYEGALWYPSGRVKESWYVNSAYQMAFYYGPAQAVDLACKIVGKKPFLTRAYAMLMKSCVALEPFTTQSWTWSTSNVLGLEASLNEKDRKEFGFDIRGLHWPTYIDIYAQGIRQFLFKNEASTQAACRRKLWVLMLLHWMVQGGFWLLLLWGLFRIFM